MNIYKWENHQSIIENEDIVKLMRLTMFNPTDGRIKSAVDGIYGKEQGRFYVCEEDQIIGIVGVRRVDNAFVEIMHLAVDESHRNKGIARALIKYVRDSERVDEIIVSPEEKDVAFFKHLGFKVEEEYDQITDVVRFICRLKG
ncbi:GNAT family N-acetyltransferase [Acidaminobacter sp. JC074]|uniref:GNAT family N-acetyltransferase n=1 Tax=Acidaminobacter sp. JC074 TaxID=2530199 RepID=UPI001F0D7B02|nr:GNAT family N-acetyltransferase [Acidaminobacter sp. JC074]MCH4887294.1 GNAT family N-acetyltransferase [Acidaminobacter sp. JC074]